MGDIVLHGYFRSSTSFRARIALNVKGVNYRQITHRLKLNEQRSTEYLALNPQGLVPSLVWSDGTVITQSMAIIEFLDETVPEPPLLPADAAGRARVRSLAQIVGCDIHPLNNLRVLKSLHERFAADETAVKDWFQHWANTGFAALEQRLVDSTDTGRFCHGDTLTLADIALVTQVINNRRFDVPLAPYPTIARIADECLALPAVERAMPQHQPDAE